MNLTDVRVVPDVDRWKLVFTFGKMHFSIILRRQDDLPDVADKLLALAKNFNGDLPDPRHRTTDEAEQPAIEMLRQVFESGVLKHAECPSWLSARVSAFLKAAG